MARYPSADANFLAMALIGYEAEKQRLDAAIADLKARLDHGQPVVHGESVPRKRTMSAAARKRIAAAQRARWAAVKKASKAEPERPKRKLTAAARRRIAEATRKRWAAYRNAKKAGAGAAA
jgi:hypothetical protein